MLTAQLVAEDLSQFCPITNHYQCSDGQWLLVTLPKIDVAETVSFLGITVPISKTHIPTQVDVFLSDVDQNVLDADGDLANGMTPLGSFDVDTHEAALTALGYILQEATDG